MKRAIILHGTLGSPYGNWFSWLKVKLESSGYDVWLPQLPSADTPSLKKWSDYVIKNSPFEINSDTLIIGHSSGAICALIIAQQSKSIGHVICVSVFHDNSLHWAPNNKLFDVTFDWHKLAGLNKKLLFIHADNDPYVPLNQAQYVADACQAELLVLRGQGHFNTEQGDAYKQFPALLNELQKRNML